MVFQECDYGKQNSSSEGNQSNFDCLEMMKEARQLFSGQRMREHILNKLTEAVFLSTILVEPTIPKELKAGLDEIKAKSIDLDGDKVTIKLDKAKYKKYDGCPELWFDKTIKATVERDGAKINVKDISGVMVDPGQYLPWANIKSAVFEKDNNGKTIVHVKGGRFGVNHTERIELPGDIYDTLNKTMKDNGK